jgi:hypothetical protein
MSLPFLVPACCASVAAEAEEIFAAAAVRKREKQQQQLQHKQRGRTTGRAARGATFALDALDGGLAALPFRR